MLEEFHKRHVLTDEVAMSIRSTHVEVATMAALLLIALNILCHITLTLFI